MIDRADPAAAPPGQLAPPSQQLQELWDNLYLDLHGLPSLPGELSQPLWVAKRAAVHNPVILVDLEQGSGGVDNALMRYQRATAVDLEHFGVPVIVDARSPEAQHPYLAWTVESGHTLRADLADGRYPSQRKLIELARSLAEILAELHRFGHSVGSLTPASVWMGPAGMAQILALGLGSHSASSGYGEGLRYRAPEQLSLEPRSMSERLMAGDMRERADLWALGMIILELVDRRPRLRCKEPSELLVEMSEANLEPSEEISKDLRELLSQLLVFDVEQRTLGADELSTQLDDLLIGPTSNSVPRSRDTDPPVPIPAADHWHAKSAKPDWTWRSAARDLQARRRAFDQGPELPTWRIWIYPTAALAGLVLVIWALISLF